MGFFWSGPRASVAGIFRRSARYWLVSYVQNSLFDRRARRAPDRFSPAEDLPPRLAAPQTVNDLAEAIGYRAGQEAVRKGWTREHATMVARRRLSIALRRRGLVHAEPSTPIGPQWDPQLPPAVHRSGGLRGGAAAGWARKRYVG